MSKQSLKKCISELTSEVLTRRNAQAVLVSSMLMIECQPDGTILSVNDNFLRVMGYSLAELLGQHHRLLCADEFVYSTEYQALWERLRAGESFSSRQRRIKKNGEPCWIDARYFPALDDNANVRAIVACGYEITEDVFHVEMDAALSGAVEALACHASEDLDPSPGPEHRLEELPAIAEQVESLSHQIHVISQQLHQLIGAAQTIGEIANQAKILALQTEEELVHYSICGRGKSRLTDEILGLIANSQASLFALSGSVQSIKPCTESMLSNAFDMFCDAQRCLNCIHDADQLILRSLDSARVASEKLQSARQNARSASPD